MTTSWPLKSTGISQHVDGSFDRVPPFGERTGDHLWIIATVYRVDPNRGADPKDPIHLDTENLIMVSGAGCFYCEVAYSPLMATRRCKGEPRG